LVYGQRNFEFRFKDCCMWGFLWMMTVINEYWVVFSSMYRELVHLQVHRLLLKYFCVMMTINCSDCKLCSLGTVSI